MASRGLATSGPDSLRTDPDALVSGFVRYIAQIDRSGRDLRET